MGLNTYSFVLQFISSGASPTIQMKHLPESSREPIVDLVVATFQGTLVNLLRTTNEDKAYIPSNPMDQGNGGEDWNGKHRNESNGCHQNLCYPAYLVSINFGKIVETLTPSVLIATYIYTLLSNLYFKMPVVNLLLICTSMQLT